MSAPGISISFASQIDAFAKAHDLDLDQEMADSINITLQNVMQVQGANVAFLVGKDRTGTIEEALAVYSEGTPRKSKAQGSHVPVSAGANRTERAVATNATKRTALSEWKAAEAVKLVERHGNPWKTGNSTHRAIVMNTNQELSNRLKAEAGIKP